MKKPIPLVIDIEMLEKLENYLYTNRIKSRSAFICELITEKLDSENFQSDKK